nr:Alpha-galactosidase precursor (EC 3.2.1.22) [uncultured bacterium]
MIAQYPPMGWNSWDCYGAAVTEDTVRANAEYMAKHLKQYGWEYVVVDIQWYQPTASTHMYERFSDVCMDAYGRLVPAPNRFPSAAGDRGFGPLADYIHSLGLKFGIHIMRGVPRMAAHRRLPVFGTDLTCDQIANPNSICAWNPDMYGLRCGSPEGARWPDPVTDGRLYYDSIFRLYAEWGVDFVKCDDIAREYPHCEKEIEAISDACRGCGRDMVLSLSPGPAPLERAGHLKRYANMWRITDDFWDEWPLLRDMFERAEKWCVHAGPGAWPDADMLPLGALRCCYEPDDADAPDVGPFVRKQWTRFTQPEQRTMMTLWGMMRSPLMMGGDMTKNDDFTLSLLTNGAVLAIGRESFCGHPVFRDAQTCAWIAPRRDGRGLYAAVFNLSDAHRTVKFPAQALEGGFSAATELWSGAKTDALKADLPPHDAAVWLVEY